MSETSPEWPYAAEHEQLTPAEASERLRAIHGDPVREGDPPEVNMDAAHCPGRICPGCPPKCVCPPCACVTCMARHQMAQRIAPGPRARQVTRETDQMALGL